MLLAAAETAGSLDRRENLFENCHRIGYREKNRLKILCKARRNVAAARVRIAHLSHVAKIMASTKDTEYTFVTIRTNIDLIRN